MATGDSLIPTDGTDTYKISSKCIGIPTTVGRANEADDYSEFGWGDFSNVTNSKTTGAITADGMLIVNYTASIPVATIQDPKQVEYVLEKYIAQSSHSVFKGANITGLIGVPTGSGDGAMESGYLGDCDIGVADYSVTLGDEVAYFNGAVLLLSEENGFTALSQDDGYYEYVGSSSGSFTPSSGSTFALPDWQNLGLNPITTTPTHNTISLSSTGDKASKAFLTIASDSDGELYAQWVVEEKVKDADSGEFNDDTGEFEQLTNGIVSGLNGPARTVVASKALGLLKEI